MLLPFLLRECTVKHVQQALSNTRLCVNCSNIRGLATSSDDWKKRNKTILTYIAATGVGMIGLSYAAATGLGGTAVAGQNTDQVETMKPVRDHIIKVSFNVDTDASIQWNFRPQQSEIYVVPGETALAFYRAWNPMDKPVIGISTYNVVPFEAGQYFNKIQVNMKHLNKPMFDDDPRMAQVDTNTLSYTFFEAKEGQRLPIPGYS
uniref:Cytochrome c oxidase assembly homolog 11 (yeast) n=1 Tax=Cyprinus carpio carpio TaxID=630221 RepID=A0A8C1ANK2_CYPCA